MLEANHTSLRRPSCTFRRRVCFQRSRRRYTITDKLSLVPVYFSATSDPAQVNLPKSVKAAPLSKSHRLISNAHILRYLAIAPSMLSGSLVSVS